MDNPPQNPSIFGPDQPAQRAGQKTGRAAGGYRTGVADWLTKPGGQEVAACWRTDQLIQTGREGEDHYCLQDGGGLDVGKEDCKKKHVALEVLVGQGITLACRRRTSSWR